MSPTEQSSLLPASRPEHQAVLQARRADLIVALRSLLPQGSSEIVWEVGCGHGHFLEAYAKAHPQRVCIGIDIESDRVNRARRKRDRAQLANLHFLRAEARLFVETLPPEVRFTSVFVLFPDPWPKLRHHKHRVMQKDFLTAVAERMSAGGRLYFRTDDLDYFAWAERLIHEHPRWQLIAGEWEFEHQTVFQSRAAHYRSLIAEAVPNALS